VTPNSPTWSDVRDFLAADDWRELRSSERGGSSSDHVFYEKLLPDRRLLRTHVSHSASKTLSAGRFGTILREQLEVSRDEFWEAIRSGEPVSRPVPLDDPVAYRHPAWIVSVLVGQLHLDSAAVEALEPDEAEALVRDFWSRAR